MNCDAIQPLLEEYALDLLPAEEMRLVEAHLATCPACRQLVEEYAAIVATLPEAVAAASPYRLPAALKQRILDQLAEPEQSAEGEVMERAAGPGEASAPARTPVPVRRTPSLLMSRLQRYALAAALLLLALAVAWGIQLNVALARERSLRSEYVELVGQQHELVIEVIDSAHTVRRVLRSTSDASNAYGKVFTRDDMSYIVAMAARLPVPSADQGYYLWLETPAGTQLAGMMEVNAEGFGLLIFDAGTIEHNYSAAILTLQPAPVTEPALPPALRWQAD
ncbi:MAG: anti-sigma factor [Caldilineaceae bacterium]|nr:anti-sigma factor [Caldilineaceae bacterium]